ncbi:MAG: hypothetical protein K2Q26_15100 [Bdellovibrionales bacterium]|nr:hypothetical protein [Bdellovibrionales bacterium]
MDSETRFPHKGGFPWQYKDHNFYGYSIAGVSTSLVYENQKIAFDIAQGIQFNIPCNHYFITHGHADHASGLNYVLSQRSLWGLKPAKVYLPTHYYENFLKLIELWQEIEDFKYHFELVPVEPGDRITIDKNSAVEVFKTVHRVPSVGYTFLQQKKKLKNELQNLSREQILDIKNAQGELHQMIDERLFSFTGDATIDFLKTFKDPVSVLFMETTFIDDKKSIAAAREWGHIHLDEWAKIIPSIPAEKIVMIHLSARHSTREVIETLDRKIPPEFRHKVEVFPRPF